MLRLNRPANKALFGLLVAVLCTKGLIAQFSSDTRLVVVHASVTDRNGKLVNCRRGRDHVGAFSGRSEITFRPFF